MIYSNLKYFYNKYTQKYRLTIDAYSIFLFNVNLKSTPVKKAGKSSTIDVWVCSCACIPRQKIYICHVLWYQSIPIWFQNLFPNLTWRLPGSDSRDVYLTFDDGPHPEISLWVAEQLEKHHMKGTFFCVGDNVRKFPETAATLIQKGHRLGNHTMHHLKGWNTDKQTYAADVAECASYVSSPLFRPPYGRIKRAQINLLKMQYRIVMWSVLSCDFDQALKPEKALKGLFKKTRNGSIVVFHDSVKAEKNLKYILPRYLEFLNENGFICKTL